MWYRNLLNYIKLMINNTLQNSPSKKIKLLLLIDSLGSGGAQRQMVTLALMFKERGIDVSLLCYSKQDFFVSYLEKENIPVYWEVTNNYLKRILIVRKAIRNGNYDAVISFMDVPNFLNCISAIGGKKWKIITGEMSAMKNTFLSLKGKFFGLFQFFADNIICNSQNAERMWIEYFPKYKYKMGVIYNPILLPDINSIYKPKRDGKLHIIVAASYQYLKNPIGLINALVLLNENQKAQIEINWYGRKEVVTGDTRAFDDASKLIKRHKLEEVIKLNSETQSILDLMNQSDIVALFSELEGLPNAICEGMMLGKPIIMSRVSDYSRLVDESNGFLCDWDDPHSIRDAIIKAIELSDKQLVEMGGKSKSKANQLFSNLQIVNQWEDLLIK